jgi:signal transduction histidine kinase
LQVGAGAIVAVRKIWIGHVGRLASQTAAQKLLHIIGLLVIPIVVLLTLYFVKSKSEIDVVAQERAGVALVQFVLSPEAAKSDDQTLPHLEMAAGLFSSKSEQVERTSAAYFSRVGMASHVMLDAEPDVQALAEVAFELAPSYASKVNALAASIAEGQMSDGKNLAQASLFLLAAGDAQAVLRRIEGNLRRAGHKDMASTRLAFTKFYMAQAAVDQVAAQFIHDQATAFEKLKSVKRLKQLSDALLTGGAASMQTRVLQNIDIRLAARSGRMWRNVALLMVAGLGSALAGMGLAVLMVRSSLIRLDEVEVARLDAVTARAEAETIAGQFVDINADISRLNQDLAIKIKELKDAHDELIKKGRMEQLGQLIATIAHEIRNPLGAIRTTIFMVERKIADKGLGLEGHLQRVNNSVSRCDTIIGQLLDFSRTKEISSSPLQLDEWLAKTIREEASRLPETVFIDCALGLDGEMLNIDPVRMQRAIVNLLSNASEALTGQQDRAAAHSQHHIWVTTKREGNSAVISVSDNGPGISPENIERIREPLFTTKSFGTGLGIPAVEQIVLQHGGRLEILSELGKGANFKLHLPLLQTTASAA